MPPISGKRAATSPLNSEFDKRPRMGLSDEELRGLNADLQERGPLPASILHPEAVEQKYIVWAFVEVATHASNVEPVWAKKDYCRKFVEKLSDDKLRHVASIMIKARDDNEWSKLADYCVLHPSPPPHLPQLCAVLLQVESPSAVSSMPQELIEDSPHLVLPAQSEKGPFFACILNASPIL